MLLPHFPPSHHYGMCPMHDNNIAPANHVQKLSPCENDKCSSCQSCPWNHPKRMQVMGFIQRPHFQCSACAISLQHRPCEAQRRDEVHRIQPVGP
jgi:hypothetical protein